MGSEGTIQGYLTKVNADYAHAPAQIELRHNDTNEISFGRGVGNTVIWESLQISRRHSIMEYRPETHTWRLKDTSTNGMMINQQKIPKNSFVDLKDQDLISFVPTGSLSYRFVAVPNPHHQAQSLNSNTTNRRGLALEANRITNNNVPQNLTTNRRTSDDNGVEIYDVVPAKSPKRKPNHGEDGMMGKGFGQCISPPMGKRKKLPAVALDMDIDNDEGFIVMPQIRDNQVPVISLRNKEDLRMRSENIPLKSNTVELDETKKDLAMARERIRVLESEKYETERRHRAEATELLQKLQMSQSESRISQEVVYKKVVDLLESEYSCCICNEVFIQATVVDCGHTFCGHCISEWAKRKTECPNCRKPVKQQSRHTEMENFISKFFDLLPNDMLVMRNEIIAERKKEQEEAARAAAAQRNMMPGPRASVYGNFAIGGAERGVTEFFNNIHEIVNPVRLERMRFMPGPPEVNVGPHRYGAPHFMPEMPHLQHMHNPVQPNAGYGADMRRGAPYPMPPEIPRTRSARRRARPVVTFAPVGHPQAPHPPTGLDFVTVD